MTVNEAIEKLNYLKYHNNLGNCRLYIITNKNEDDVWISYDVNSIKDFKEFCVDGHGMCGIEVIDENGSNV